LEPYPRIGGSQENKFLQDADDVRSSSQKGKCHDDKCNFYQTAPGADLLQRRGVMINIFKKQNGMNIVGQGGKIILFMLPSLMAALWVHTYFPHIAELPRSLSFIKPVGYVLLAPGIILWALAVIQLLTGFSKGKLVTTGAYGVVRNPIYSSVALFILPAVALITLTWVYLVVAVVLYTGVMIFIGTEEKQLTRAFGKQYEDYLAQVDRLIPLKKP
jgi:protein-S-isoprenylcysteine O-methyltransferase Ste14